MNYVAFLQWALSNLPKFKKLFELLEQIGALFTAEDVGTLGVTEAIVLNAECPMNDEEMALEEQLASALVADGSMTQAAFDGSRLRKVFELFKTLGPLLPALIGLFGKTA